MTSPLHSKQTVADGIHTPISFEYPSVVERVGAAGFTSEDISKFARQLDDNSLWMLVSVTPIWVEVTGVAVAATTDRVELAARKATAGTITKGQAVYAVGYDVGAGEVLVELAKADSSTTMDALGVASSSFNDTVPGTVLVLGILTGVDTSGFTVNEHLVVSDTVAGDLAEGSIANSSIQQNVATTLFVDPADGVLAVDREIPENFAGLSPTDVGIRLGQTLVTGLITGGELSINGGDPTKFDIAAGEGIVVDSHTNPTAPVVTRVTWDAFTALTPTGAGSTVASRVAIDSAGTVVQQTGAFTQEQHRDLIVLGSLAHLTGTTIDAVGMLPRVSFNRDMDTADLLEAIGPVNIFGNVYGPNGSNLNIDKSAGQTFNVGTNYAASKKRPSVTSDAAQAALTLNYAYQDGLGGFVSGPDTAVADPAQYDDGSGTLAAVQATEWTVQLLFHFNQTNDTIVQYGQQSYPTKDDAIRGRTDPANLFVESGRATFRGWLVVRGDATDLSNDLEAVFFSAGKFGQTEASPGSISTATNSVMLQVRNESGSTIARGKMVASAGFDAASGRPLVDLADKDDPLKRPAIGVAKADIPNNTNADVLVVGRLAGFDTSAFSTSAQLALGDDGDVSLPPPDEDPFTGEVQLVGSVVRVDATVGEIFFALATGLIPTTADQTFALAGTDGTPSKTNPYVTDSDPRLVATGDNVSVNGVAADDADFDDATPAAPGDGVNVRWQKDASTPNNVSANAPVATPGAIQIGDAAAEGSAASVARSDHTHSLAAPAAPQPVGTQAAGTSTAPARGDHVHALQTSQATATADTTTTSATDVLVSGMTLTPAAGTYLVWFTGSVDHGSNGGTIEMSIYAGGVQNAASERRYLRGNQALTGGFACVAQVTVNGAQAVEGRWRTSGATATMHERTLSLLRVA